MHENRESRVDLTLDHRAAAGFETATGSNALWVKQALNLRLKDKFLPQDETFDPSQTGNDPSHQTSCNEL
ncbi:hypothetical protein XENOCAPTIV_012765, partial [Xenoophorus captivus]